MCVVVLMGVLFLRRFFEMEETKHLAIKPLRDIFARTALAVPCCDTSGKHTGNPLFLHDDAGVGDSVGSVFVGFLFCSHSATWRFSNAALAAAIAV